MVRTIDGDVFWHQMPLCGNSLPDDGYYHQTIHLGEVIMHMLTTGYAINWKQIYSFAHTQLMLLLLALWAG